MERKNGSFFSFIPRHLEIEGRPELNNFPYNVLIAMYRATGDGRTEMGSVVYEPDFSAYKVAGITQSLSYLNIYNHDYRLNISYNTEGQSYRCDKFKNDENLGIAVGKDWKMFFVYVGMIGLANGESCMFEIIK